MYRFSKQPPKLSPFCYSPLPSLQGGALFVFHWDGDRRIQKAKAALGRFSGFLMVDGSVAAYFGDEKRAIERLRQSYKLAEISIEGGTLMGALTASAIRGMTIIYHEALSQQLRLLYFWG